MCSAQHLADQRAGVLPVADRLAPIARVDAGYARGGY
jgi:hypothetical protein